MRGAGALPAAEELRWCSSYQVALSKEALKAAPPTPGAAGGVSSGGGPSGGVAEDLDDSSSAADAGVDSSES